MIFRVFIKLWKHERRFSRMTKFRVPFSFLVLPRLCLWQKPRKKCFLFVLNYRVKTIELDLSRVYCHYTCYSVISFEVSCLRISQQSRFLLHKEQRQEKHTLLRSADSLIVSSLARVSMGTDHCRLLRQDGSVLISEKGKRLFFAGKPVTAFVFGSPSLDI